MVGVGDVWLNESTGDSNYTALQIWVNRRFSHGLAFQAAYTWSHAITNVPLDFNGSGATDPYNYNLDRGDADLDRRQMFVATAVYLLPSFKRWGAPASHILGDWQLNGIVSLLGGMPINVISGANAAGRVFAGAQRPNLVAGVPIYLNRPDDRLQYLNAAAFSLPDVGRFGSLGRGAIRGPGTKNLDASIVKNWTVRDHYYLQLRGEMFNAFNHANLSGVASNLVLDETEKLPNGKLNPNFGKSLNSNFGRLTGTRGPREIQFGLKFSF